MICQHCGHQEIQGSAFCSGCGSSLIANGLAAFGAPMTTVASQAVVGRNCPYCRFPLKPGGQVCDCESCHAVHHADCWAENRGCAVMGCAGAPAQTQATAVFAGAGLASVPAPPQHSGMDYAQPAGLPAPATFDAPPPPTPYPAANIHDSGGSSSPRSAYLKMAALIGGVVLAMAAAAAAVVIASSSKATAGAQPGTVTRAVIAPDSSASSSDQSSTSISTDGSGAPSSVASATSAPDTPTDTTSPPVEIRAMLDRHFSDIQQGKLHRAYSDLTGAATGASEAGWISGVRADGLYDYRLKVDPTISGDSATATIVHLHTEASSSGCHNWSGSWNLTQSGGQWYIAKSNLVRHSGTCGG